MSDSPSNNIFDLEVKTTKKIMKSFLNKSNLLFCMEATIVNYRRNSTGQTNNHLVVKISSVDTKDKASKFVGKKVIYNTGKKDIVGKINAIHGNSGALRAVFTQAIPGQALGGKVTIE
jgi:large subunit ribosomal protein L35Ae